MFNEFLAVWIDALLLISTYISYNSIKFSA